MDLAYWTGETGDVVGAREGAATVTKDMTQVLGANHRHTLFARGNVCRWTALSGEAGRARELATAVVEDMMGCSVPMTRTRSTVGPTSPTQRRCGLNSAGRSRAKKHQLRLPEL
jgi:hypothetical protein